VKSLEDFGPVVLGNYFFPGVRLVAQLRNFAFAVLEQHTALDSERGEFIRKASDLTDQVRIPSIRGVRKIFRRHRIYRNRHTTGEHVRNDVIFALAMHQLEIIRLQPQCPTRQASLWVLQPIKPQETMVVGDNDEVHTFQIVAQLFYRPDNSEALAFRGGIITLLTGQRTREVADCALPIVEFLRQDRTDSVGGRVAL
jgi:hypothetical protein